MPRLKKYWNRFFGSNFTKYHNEALNEEQVGETGPDPYFFTRPEFIREEAKTMVYRRRRSTKYPGYRRGRRRLVMRSRKRRAKPSSATRLKRARIGYWPGKEWTKRYQTFNFTNELINTRQPQIWDVNDVAESSFNNTERHTREVNARGVSYCLGFNNPTAGFKKLVNVAFVTLRTNQLSAPETFEGLTTGGGDKLTNIVNFFRSKGTEENRSIDFTNADFNFLSMHCTPINRDKFVILKHHRFILNSRTDHTGTSEEHDPFHADKKVIKGWLPFKRLMTYTGTGANSSLQPVYMIVWCDAWGRGPTDPKILDALEYSGQATFYFKEPRGS